MESKPVITRIVEQPTTSGEASAILYELAQFSITITELELSRKNYEDLKWGRRYPRLRLRPRNPNRR